MHRLVALLILLLLVHKSLALRLTDKLAKDAGEILAEARTDRTIRQCSCPEQHVCFQETKQQLYECMEECWDITKQITNNTDGLRECLRDRIPIAENFFDCLENNLDSCSDSKTADNITYIDYNKVIESAESRIKKQTLKLVRSVGTNAQKIIKTALDLGSCSKSCFMKKNSNGFCFDRVGCQSKIEVGAAVKGLKKCAATIQWKKTAFETCECAVDAGVDSVKQYCNMLKTIERGRSKPAEMSS